MVVFGRSYGVYFSIRLIALTPLWTETGAVLVAMITIFEQRYQRDGARVLCSYRGSYQQGRVFSVECFVRRSLISTGRRTHASNSFVSSLA